jgi:hypothetical protein
MSREKKGAYISYKSCFCLMLTLGWTMELSCILEFDVYVYYALLYFNNTSDGTKKESEPRILKILIQENKYIKYQDWYG